jgi:hypothetical protein
VETTYYSITCFDGGLPQYSSAKTTKQWPAHYRTRMRQWNAGELGMLIFFRVEWDIKAKNFITTELGHFFKEQKEVLEINTAAKKANYAY